MNKAIEMNFDGLIGPTHNFGGLSFGNIASMTHKSRASNPKAAALQGLAKMRILHQLGIPQAVLPPHARPYIPALIKLGFTGSSIEVIAKAWKSSPQLLIQTSSAASMWTANAATICPSIDSTDGRLHITPANLISNLHRSFEADMTASILRKIFADEKYFCHHDPLPPSYDFADEGAANHTRFASRYGEKGVHLFAYGRSAFNKLNAPDKFPARQTLEASEAIARLHQIPKAFFAQQNPEIIDQGVFHNDVIAVGNQNLFFLHEKAYVNQKKLLETLKKEIENFQIIEVCEEEIPVKEAVTTYLFNSQLVALPNGKTALIAPIECKNSSIVSSYLQNLPFEIHYVDLRESMQNGGGPACLRLRVVLTQEESNHILQSVIFNDNLDHKLSAWINKHYRDQLHPQDLADPELIKETQNALNELTQILHLGDYYCF